MAKTKKTALKKKGGIKSKATKKTKKKVVKKQPVDKDTVIINAILLDSSGSMSSTETSVVTGVNEVLAEARKDEQKTGLKNVDFLAFFGSTYREYDKPVTEVVLGPSGESRGKGVVGYSSDLGMTALWYSAYRLITKVEKEQAQYKNSKVILTIFTDGGENDSPAAWRDGTKLKEIIEAKQKAGWVINFIGEGDLKSVQAASGTVGIFASNTMNFSNTDAGVKKMSAQYSVSRSAYTQSVAIGTATNDGFFSTDEPKTTKKKAKKA